MTRKQNIRFILCFLVFLSALVAGPVSFAQPLPFLEQDIRIIIDVSGSMSENDPKNFRMPAMRMAARLLPEGSQAGVWMFENFATNLVPVGRVNKQWIEIADEGSEKIHSDGLLTNIGEAIQEASMGWTDPNPREGRNLIILTDGIVDISENGLENKESRTNILETIIPSLKKADVRVHTIALSHDADSELLEQMALSTEGLYQKILTADDLQKVFLNIFDQAIHRDILPIKENIFKVDKDVEEITVLVFSQYDGQREPVRLRSPYRKLYSQINAADTMQWFQEGLVDLVTITKPSKGDWLIIGSIDPDNRVMVVSHLALESSELPSNLFSGEILQMEANLLDKKEVVRNQDFLKFVEFYTEFSLEGSGVMRFNLSDDGKLKDYRAIDGIYVGSIGPIPFVNEQKNAVLVTSANGKTFSRQRQQTVRILPTPVTIDTLTTVGARGKSKIDLKVVPDISLIKPDTLKVTAVVTDNLGMTEELPVARENPLSWALSLIPKTHIKSYQAKMRLEAESLSGRLFTAETQAINIMVPKVKIAIPKPKRRVTKTTRKSSTASANQLSEKSSRSKAAEKEPSNVSSSSASSKSKATSKVSQKNEEDADKARFKKKSSKSSKDKTSQSSDEKDKVAKESDKDKNKDKPEKSSDKQEDEAKPPVAPEDPGVNWGGLAGVFVLFNLLVGVGGFLGYRFMKKAGAKEANVADALGEDD